MDELVPFLLTMIIFNTLKKAEHYVKWCNKTKDFQRGGYDWETQDTYIDGDLVIVSHAGDGCGCGCDYSLFDYKVVIGRIKDKRTKNINLVLNNP